LNKEASEILFTPETLFPINAEIFEALLGMQRHELNCKIKSNGTEESITDGEALFHLVISKIYEQGVKFTSPGNSKKRNFIVWFNSHFINDSPYSYQIEIKKQFFDRIYEMVLKLNIESYPIQQIINKAGNSILVNINNEARFTPLGKELLNSIFQQTKINWNLYI
jgi:hypothetical protein